MAAYIRSLPFFVVLLVAAAGAMMVPAFYAAATQDHGTARDFFYGGLLTGIAGGLVGLATQNTRHRISSERGYLVTLLLSYLWLPVVLCLPMLEAVSKRIKKKKKRINEKKKKKKRKKKRKRRTN